MINQEQCWKAVERHDGKLDGEFFFGVMTTGVYCRPSCASRLPLRKNVRFYATAAEAERDGLRPCKRCRPLDPERDRATAKVRELCRHIEAHPDEAPDWRSWRRERGSAGSIYSGASRRSRE